MADLQDVLYNIAPSIDPTMKMVTGLSYLLAVILLWTSLKKLKDMADQRARYTGGGRMFIPVAYAMGGLALLYLPTMWSVAQNTFFGSTSPIAYANWIDELKARYGNATYIMFRLVQLSGVVWFIRGIQLLVQASEPGVQHGPKGMAFMIAGVLAINVQQTANVIAYVLSAITTSTV